MAMNKIDRIIEDPRYYYDRSKIEGFIKYCENELTLTDGSPVKLLFTFKLWAEDILCWFYFIEKQVFVPDERGGGHYVRKKVKVRLRNKQYAILGRGGAKTLYESYLQSYFLNIDTTSTFQVTTAPTMNQADEVLGPMRTSVTLARGPLFKFLTEGSNQNTTGNKAYRQKLFSSKKGIENTLTNSLLVIRPMSIDKLQGLRPKISTVDEWLSGDIREDVVGALEQGANKVKDWLIIAVSSEGTVRNGPGDNIKLELMSILKGDYKTDHVSIWWYKLDSIDEVGNPNMWLKAQPNLGQTVSYEAYQEEVARAEANSEVRNDTLAKRFGLPMEGYSYFFTYEETIPHKPRDFWKMPCSLGADLSMGDDFCAFTLMFPLKNRCFGIKTRSYISELTLNKLPGSMRNKYEEFIKEGTLIIMEGTILNMLDVYDDVIKWIDDNEYDVRSFGYDPYNAKDFVERWSQENTDYGVEKVIQGARTESVPLGELKKLASEGMLLFDEELMSFAMENAMTMEDTNGNRKLYKHRKSEKIDNVAAMMDAFVAYKLHMDEFE